MRAAFLLADLSPDQRFQLLLALGILMALVVIGGTCILIFRHKLKDDGSDVQAGVGFSLSDLRTMRDQGEITDEEYEATRAKVIASVKASLASRPPKKSGPDKHDPSGQFPAS